MPSLSSHCRSFDFVLDRHIHQLSTSKMTVSKATGLVKKAAAAVKSKTGALRAKLLVLASLRRRMAVVAAVSRRIHALVSSPHGRERQGSVEYGGGKALALRKALAAAAAAAEAKVDELAGDHGGVVLDLYEAAMFDEEDHGYPDWTQSLFDDDDCYDVQDGEEQDGRDDDHDVHEAALDDETSVVEIIRSKRQVEGLEFSMDDNIDEACDMFIRRFRSRMNRSF
ncbi:hypothetical protein ACP70R_044473 [Stipagrostis hirtigluma subsp. patula]